MNLRDLILPKILIIMLLVLALPECSSAQQGGIELAELHNLAIMPVLRYNSLDSSIGYGTGIMLFNYDTRESIYLLTARHVFEEARKIDLLMGNSGKGFKKLLKSPITLYDSSGNALFQTFTSTSGTSIDLAIIPIFAKDKAPDAPDFKILTRSACLFSDSVFVGDRLLAIGFADTNRFDFIRSGDPLATSGVVAFETEYSYVLDKKTHKGMSGGIVFKEFPSKDRFLYRAVGVVSSGLSKYMEYSWITKLDFIDSIMVKLNGKPWGESK